MEFVIEKQSNWSTTYRLRLPIIPGLRWPYIGQDLGTRGIDDYHPNDQDAQSMARSILKKNGCATGDLQTRQPSSSTKPR
jgi:hypothetical protein